MAGGPGFATHFEQQGRSWGGRQRGSMQDKRLHFHADYWIRSFGESPGNMGHTSGVCVCVCVLVHTSRTEGNYGFKPMG